MRIDHTKKTPKFTSHYATDSELRVPLYVLLLFVLVLVKQILYKFVAILPSA